MTKPKSSKELMPTQSPPSVTPLWLSFFSLLGFVATLSYSLRQLWHPYAVMWTVSLGILVPALGYEIVASRASRQIRAKNTTGSANRVYVKRVGFIATLLAWAFAAWLFPYYSEPGQHLWEMATYPATVLATLSGAGTPDEWLCGVGVLVLVIANIYIAYTDRRLESPRDGLFTFGAWILRRKEDVDSALLKQYVLQWIVKIFFLPWMLTWMHNNIVNLEGYSWDNLIQAYRDHTLSGALFFVRNWGILQTLMFTIDLAFALVGYACTLKLFGTHIRSAQSTLFGWVICLSCYAPFQQVTGNAFLSYDGGARFEILWADYPVMCAIWAGIVLTLLAIYTFATVQFGVRFSNLTNRGVLTNGVYAWTKHPAYITKNTMWWFVAVPFFVTTDGQDALRACLHLALTNYIYYCRAKTEEKHLSEDEIYRRYVVWIDGHGVVAKIRQFFRYVFLSKV